MSATEFGGGAPIGIRNLESLLQHGLRGPRELALSVAAAGLAACDPGRAVERLVRMEDDVLVVGDSRHPIKSGGRIVVLGSGKASLKIGAGLERVLGDRVSGGTIAVREGGAAFALDRVEVREAAHPIPDERSVAAAERILEQAAELGPDDVVLASFTGGSSALTSLPPPGVPFADKRELHRLLLSSGMPIAEVNTVRKQVSAFKGGRLALAAAPATVINLAVSDVAGDVLDALTDPSVPNESTVADAVAVLRGHDLWARTPESVRAHLTDAELAAPDLSGVDIHTTLLVTGETACEAMAATASAAGAEPVVVSTSLEDEAGAVGRILASLATEGARAGHATGRRVLIGCGGESTVKLGDDDEFGQGGPNQEAALSAATLLDGTPVAAVFADTDGSDGGTDLAGAEADGETCARAAELGIDIGEVLSRHRSGVAVARLGDGIDTGPTHTNVNDLFVVAVDTAG